jgi:hypothetical protein
VQQPQFPSGICDATFDRAEEYVTSLLHDGGAYPVALSCDDTALLGAYRVMLDNTTDSWFLVGAVGNPIPCYDQMIRLFQNLSHDYFI